MLNIIARCSTNYRNTPGRRDLESANKDKFIANASHELRVSHKSINAIITVLKKHVQQANSAALTTIVNDLQTSCDISFNVNDNMLEYQKIQAGSNTMNRQNSFDARSCLVILRSLSIFSQ